MVQEVNVHVQGVNTDGAKESKSQEETSTVEVEEGNEE